MHIPTLLLSLSLPLLALADAPSSTSSLGLTSKPSSKLVRRDNPSLLSARQSCSGSCTECFGSGYAECPADSSLCYQPANGPGSSRCMGSGGSGSGGNGGSGTPNTCSQRGATCVSCFGAGNIDCPAGSKYDCYNPAEGSVQERCNDGPAGGSGGGAAGSATGSAPAPTGSGGAGGASSQCVAQFGAGSVLCGTDTCYNPGQGDVCCADGSHCENNSECVQSGSEYKCRPNGGSGSGSGSAATSSAGGLGGGILATTATGSGLFGSATARETRSRTTTSSAAAATTQSGGSGGTSGAGRVEVAGLGMAVLVGAVGML